MTRGPEGYGRYNDDPETVGCPRAQSDMTPCVARDGSSALADDMRCVGCGQDPRPLLTTLRHAATGKSAAPVTIADHAADKLRDLVRKVTELPGASRPALVKKPPSWHISLAHIFDEITAERLRQEAKFGEENHPDGTGTDGLFLRYGALAALSRAIAEDDPAKLRAELVKVAAVAVNWIQAIDRRDR